MGTDALVATRAHLAEEEPAGDRDRRQALGGRAIAEWTPELEAPAVRPGCPGNSARRCARHQRPLGGIGTLPPLGRRSATGGRAVPERAIQAAPPAVSPIGRGYSAGMDDTRANVAKPEWHRREA
jgi:hypothetical protein